jgi:hypothetical protein
MRLEEVTAEIRPRSDWEAVDLGLAMVRRDFWRCWLVWWLAMIVPVALAGWFLWESPGIWVCLFWWWKPAGSRLVLFEISRRLFGEKPKLSESLREIPAAWGRRFFHRFIWARLSPWLPVTLAVEDLERLKGPAYRQRARQVTRRGEGAILWIYFISDAAACWLGIAVLMLLRLFIPDGQESFWQELVESWNPEMPFEIPAALLRVVAFCLMVGVSLTDVFVIGAGFGVYINNRTWIEGWDVELAFKGLAKRLGPVVAVILSFAFCLQPGLVCAAAERLPADEIRRVKQNADFEVHSITERIPIPKSGSGSWIERFFEWLANLLGNGGKSSSASLDIATILGWTLVVSLGGILLAWIGWLFWVNRHAFLIRQSGGEDAPLAPTARVVMGMEVTPESLPADIPATAWGLWQQGHHQEAMGLLYRGTISKVIEVGRVEIQESDTEGDCVRRVEQVGPAAHPDYFRGLTSAWTRLAYARLKPEDGEVEALCQRWPFMERRRA